MEQIRRIRHMEQLLDLALENTNKFSMSQEEYHKTKKIIAILSQYYGSDEWKIDFETDEAGLLPKDLKRGVLSEDGIWNLLSRWKEIENTRHPKDKDSISDTV